MSGDHTVVCEGLGWGGDPWDPDSSSGEGGVLVDIEDGVQGGGDAGYDYGAGGGGEGVDVDVGAGAEDGEET